MIRVLAVMDGTGTGGAETSMAAMAPLLAGHGVELEVAYFHDRSGAREKFAEAGVILHHVPHGRTRLATVWRLRRLIRQRDPDLVHTMVFEADIIGRTAAFLARVPVMSSIINEMYGPEQLSAARYPWKVRAGQLADIATARFVRQFHAITHAVADVMAPRLRIDRSKIRVVYRGRDPQQLGTRSGERRARVRRELGIEHDTPVMLAVGRQEYQKGFDLLLDAMPRIRCEVPAAVLLVAGRRGSVSDSLEAQGSRLGLDGAIRWLGHRDDIADLLVASDVMVFPSRWEGLGSAVVEAIMLETPVVTSDLSVLREVSDVVKADVLLTLVGASDPAALASGVVRQLQRVSSASARSEPVAIQSDDLNLAPFLLDAVAGHYSRLANECAVGIRRSGS